MVLRGWGPRSAPRLVLDCPLPLPQCSSLMLIESTRESPCFTVTHYKHSKQQYNIQVRGGLGRGLGTEPAPSRCGASLRASLWKGEVVVGTSQACAEESR